jgi:hypothetical protein
MAAVEPYLFYPQTALNTRGRHNISFKMCDFSGETFKGFEVLQFSMSATTTQLLSSGELCKLRYDTKPVKSASANVSFYTNNSKNAKF